MEILRLELLGGMSVYQGSRLLSAELSKKAQALLCYLAVTARPHSRDTLAGLLWSDFPEQRARANLRDTLSLLHRALPQHLVIERSSISFVDIPSRTWIDSAVFQMHVEQVQQILRNTPSPTMLSSELICQVEEAVSLYQGEFLAEFYVRRAAVFENWVAKRQEHLRQLAVEALQILTTYYTSSGDYTAGLRTARQLLEMDPWWEEGHRLLMRLLALSGQYSAAMKQYEICHQVLEQELGLEPTKETAILYEAIRGGEIQPGKLDTRGYELVQLIGQGATSAVYIAYQPMVKREVAIKIILPEFASDPTFFERFGSVAQTVAQLEFPWIVPIYDYWRDVDAAYMIMRLMRGGNLRDKLDRQWPLEAVVTLITQVASALAAAHEAGVIHGNLQPSNILLDEDGNAFLSDFGTAGGGRPDSTSQYLSPEQRRSKPATGHSDIYTLGLLMYEMLADKVNARRALESQGDGFYKALANDLASTLALQQDGLAAGVVEVIQQATAYRPDDRFPDVLAMASALRRALESERYGRLPVAAGIVQRRGSRLPLDETPFIGRKEELFMLDKLIVDPKVRLINITGPGGIGKTRLALASARRQVGRFKHGVTFVSLISVEQANQLTTAVAAALELPLQDQGSPRQQLFDYLQNKHLLLILDGFEHLMSGTGVLAEMVAHAPQLTIIVTSREVLHLHEEQLFPLTGLTLSESEAAEDVFRADAPQLFLSSVRRLQPDFCLYESDFDALNRICQLVEGMPLAIELAAGWANKIALARIATQLCQSMDFLRTDDGNMADRHASIQAAFTTSWQQLDGQDQQVFKKLSVFRGGFSLEAAREISGISFVSLSRLVSKSLLQFERATDRYQMHELLRRFAAMKLAQYRDEEKAVLTSHATYFCALLGEKEKGLKGLRQDIALMEIETDLGNIRKALRSAAKYNLIDLIAQGLSSFNLYHRYRFLPDEFITICQVVGEQLQKQVDEPESSMLARRVLAKIKIMQATPYMHATIGSDYLATMESLQVLEQSRDVFRELAAHGEDVRKEQAFVLKRLGALLLNIELTRALPLLEKSLALYQQLGDRWGQSEALFYLSSGRMRLHGYFDAKPLWEESLALKRVEGDRRGLADSLAMLGIRAASHNQTADALQYAQECHDTYMRIKDPTSRAEAHWNLGVLMTWAGQYTESKESLTKAGALYRELGLHPPAPILGNTLAMLGEYDAVVEYVENYMTMVGEAGFKPNQARAYTWLCYVALARKDNGEARRLSQKGIAAYKACGLKAYAGVLYGLLAMAARGKGEQASPWRHLEKGLRIQQDRNQLGPLGIWMITPVTAVLLADAGCLQEAVTAYAFACNHPMIANSVWFNDVMGDVVRKAAAQLSPAVAAHARQEGQAAEPWQMGAKLLRVVSDFASL